MHNSDVCFPCCRWLGDEDDALLSGGGPRLLDIGEWHGAGVHIERARGDLLGQGGKFGEVLARANRALAAADDVQARGAAEGIAAVAPATAPIWIQVSGLPRSARLVRMAVIAATAGSPHR